MVLAVAQWKAQQTAIGQGLRAARGSSRQKVQAASPAITRSGHGPMVEAITVATFMKRPYLYALVVQDYLWHLD